MAIFQIKAKARIVGLAIGPLLQCPCMADWRQIQARIRKAKNSPEAVSKLSELFKRTRDGMVAWELGAIEEKADHKQEAGNWYIVAAQRFRRADWKKKAEDALIRLGLPLPQLDASSMTAVQAESVEIADRAAETESEEASPSPAHRETPQENSEAQPAASSSSSPSSLEPGRRKRRRGRRGGRGRRGKGGTNPPGLPTQAFSEQSSASGPQSSAMDTSSPPVLEQRALDRVESEPSSPEYVRPRQAEFPPPQLPSERVAHGRGDPALASRMAHLESLLRRLLGSPLRKLDAADEAPAGPGVFLLSDSDQTTSYYVEACQTLRVAIGNLARGGRSGKTRPGQGSSEQSLKSKLAEHLEINETKVAQYLKDHCVIRWIQLDDDAPVLAHFAIAVLRTPLNL